MLPKPLLVVSAILAILSGAQSASAHGIAGNRFFPGALAFDDPAVADEAIVPLFLTSKHPAEVGDGDVVDNNLNWSIFRLLPPKLGVGVDSGWINRNWGGAQRSGFDITSVATFEPWALRCQLRAFDERAQLQPRARVGRDAAG
jgi:hypothetical protein